MNILSMMGKKYTAYPNVKSVWLGRRSVQMPRPLKTQKSSFVTEECSRLHGHFFPKSPAVDCLEEMLTRNHKNKKFNLSSPQSESSSSLFNSTVLENHMLTSTLISKENVPSMMMNIIVIGARQPLDPTISTTTWKPTIEHSNQTRQISPPPIYQVEASGISSIHSSDAGWSMLVSKVVRAIPSTIRVEEMYESENNDYITAFSSGILFVSRYLD